MQTRLRKSGLPGGARGFWVYSAALGAQNPDFQVPGPALKETIVVDISGFWASKTYGFWAFLISTLKTRRFFKGPSRKKSKTHGKLVVVCQISRSQTPTFEQFTESFRLGLV